MKDEFIMLVRWIRKVGPQKLPIIASVVENFDH